MKNFNEWREGVTQHENPDMLIERLDDLAHKLEIELEAFEGERFEGFLNLIGNVKGLLRQLAVMKHGVEADVPKSFS
jgi:hypothetical protein